MNTDATPTRPTNGPDPHRDWSGASTAPSRSAGLLGLVRNLIAFGEALIRTLQAAPPSGMLAEISVRFGTRKVAVIIARITRGLMLASGLEDRLIRSANRLDTPPSRATATTRSRKRPTPPAEVLQQDDDAALLARLPTAQEIAARLRGKSVAAVLEQICHDFGITCETPLWRELNIAIIGHGGSIPRALNDMVLRVRADYVTPHAVMPLPPLTAPSFALNGTGPP